MCSTAIMHDHEAADIRALESSSPLPTSHSSVCEEQQHWKELTFLYIAYDEFDNAAYCMMAHSPSAWEHVQFKDVAVRVSSGEVRLIKAGQVVTSVEVDH